MAYRGLNTPNLILQVKANLGNRTDKVDADILTWLNLAQTRLARRKNWRELLLTTSAYIEPLTSTESPTAYKDYNQRPGSAATFSVPHSDEEIVFGNGGLKGMESVRVSFGDTDGGPYNRSYMLSYLGRRQFRRLIPDPRTTTAIEGYPTVFTEEYETTSTPGLFLYKIPNISYLIEITYFSWPTDLHTSITPVSGYRWSDFSGKDDILINMATSIGFHSLGMREQGSQYYLISEALITDAITEDEAVPSHVITGKGTSSSMGSIIGQPWSDPFVMSTGE